MGKYGPQVQALLKKASGLDIKFLCPLHGPVWRKDLDYIIEIRGAEAERCRMHLEIKQ